MLKALEKLENLGVVIPENAVFAPIEEYDAGNYRGKIGKVIKNYAKDLEEDLKNAIPDRMIFVLRFWYMETPREP